MSELALAIISTISPWVNTSIMMLTLPRRWKLGYTLAIFTAAFLLIRFPISMAIQHFTGIEGDMMLLFRGILYLPVWVVLFRGQIFQKVFAFFLIMLFAIVQLKLATDIAGYFMPSGSNGYYFLRLCALFMMFAGYIASMYIWGKRLFQKLFVNGRNIEWALYSFGAALSLAALLVSTAIKNPVLSYLSLFFILWGIFMLCFAIINTHEKTKQKFDAEFAQSIVSSGHDHYQKMDEMYDKLRIMRHDYKYHLNVVRKMLNSGSLEEADQYLTNAESQLSENELQIYCSNTVINALVAGYAERCAKLDIKFSANLAIPKQFDLRDYDMCIVLGNLLENAVEACEKQKSDRVVELAVRSQGVQLVIGVNNSFDGNILHDEGTPLSMKKDGGLGLRSVQAVAARYGGELLTEWDDAAFTAYVTVRL